MTVWDTVCEHVRMKPRMKRSRMHWLVAPMVVLAACSSSSKTTTPTSTAAPTTSTATTTAVSTSVASTSVASTAAASTAVASTSVASTTVASTTAAPTVPPSTAAVTTVEAGPAGDAFYVPPSPLPSNTPGTAIWQQPLPGIDGASVAKILYVSQADDGTPLAESAVLVVPNGPAPVGGRPIVSWAHGTTGSADSCAPSKSGNASFIPAVAQLVSAGYVVVATDYQGLGTPGPHPYLDGQSEGRAVLDAAKAAQQLSGSSNRVVAWGHSQGGQAVVWAGEIAKAYAPRLDVLGVVAAAPAAHISPIGAAGGTKAIAGFWVPAMVGLAAAHSELNLADVMTPEAMAELPLLETGCLGEYFSAFGGLAKAPEKTNPMDVPAWNAVLTKNDAGQQPSAAPLFVAQGDQDTTVPQALNDIYTKAACSIGDVVDYKVYPGLTHTTVMVSGVPDMLAWIADRLAGTPPPDTCRS